MRCVTSLCVRSLGSDTTSPTSRVGTVGLGGDEEVARVDARLHRSGDHDERLCPAESVGEIEGTGGDPEEGAEPEGDVPEEADETHDELVPKTH